MTPRVRKWILIVVILGVVATIAWSRRDWVTARLSLIILESSERVEDLQVDRVIASLAVVPGARVADIGAGTGLFTRPLARAVGGEGVVYAVDINPEMLKHIATTVAAERLDNVRMVVAGDDDPRLPERVDLVFLCDTLHHISAKGSYLRRLRRYLKPGGRIAIIDFDRASPHLMPSLKYTREQLLGWMESAGYTLERDLDFVVDNFFLIYRCDDCPTTSTSPNSSRMIELDKPPGSLRSSRW